MECCSPWCWIPESRIARIRESANTRKSPWGTHRPEVIVAGYQTVAQRNLTCAIRIRERRRELGLTQADVVGRVARGGSRLSSQALSAIENGRRLAVGRLPDLAEALDCTVTYLIGLAADPRSWHPDQSPEAAPPPRAPGAAAQKPSQPSQPSQLSPPSQPAAAPRRSWILGPDVPDLRSEGYEFGSAHATH
jgi:transcriptional regulator with XRE-family HTH domain